MSGKPEGRHYATVVALSFADGTGTAPQPPRFHNGPAGL